jgi:hypothetical protein
VETWLYGVYMMINHLMMFTRVPQRKNKSYRQQGLEAQTTKKKTKHKKSATI